MHNAGDLKPALTNAINNILQPVRDHFEKDADAAALLKKVKVRLLQPHVSAQGIFHANGLL